MTEEDKMEKRDFCLGRATDYLIQRYEARKRNEVNPPFPSEDEILKLAQRFWNFISLR